MTNDTRKTVSSKLYCTHLLGIQSIGLIESASPHSDHKFVDYASVITEKKSVAATSFLNGTNHISCRAPSYRLITTEFCTWAGVDSICYVQIAWKIVPESHIKLSSTRDPIANTPSLQSRHRYGQRGEVFQMQAGPPTAMGLRLSSLAFHATRH